MGKNDNGIGQTKWRSGLEEISGGIFNIKMKKPYENPPIV